MKRIMMHGLLALIMIGFLGSCKIGVGNKQQKSKTFTDPRDGEVYQLISIGTQTWFAENLRYNAVGFWYNSNNPNPKYGRLYDWSTALRACPAGWHLPTGCRVE